MIWLVLLATGVVATTPPADLRGFLDGRQLQEHCRPGPADDLADLRSALCLGYVVGSADQLLAVEAETPPHLRSFCPPRTTIAEDLRDAAMDLLDQHPEARDAAAATVVAGALAARYPCPADGPNAR